MIGRLKALVAGFVIGIFVAPRSGRASRQLLMERIDEFFEFGSRRLEELEDGFLHRRRSPTVDRSETSEFEPGPFPDDPLA